MLMPSIFGENLFDDFFEDYFPCDGPITWILHKDREKTVRSEEPHV